MKRFFNTVVTLFMMIILLLSACSNSNSIINGPDIATVESSSKIIEENRGNTIGNIVYGGNTAIQDDWIYYCGLPYKQTFKLFEAKINGKTSQEVKRINTKKNYTTEVSAYAPVLKSWRKAIKENFGYSRKTQEVKAYPFICQSLPNEFREAHYAYYDIDGNGIPELYIASFWNGSYAHIADAYTIKDGKPVRLFQGVEDRGFWSRNTLDFSQDGISLIIRGSGGAAHTDIFFYKISSNGYRVKMMEGLTTYDPENSDNLTMYYHLSDGTYRIATKADKNRISKKYYGKAYSDEDDYQFYPSDFHTKLDWVPIFKK